MRALMSQCCASHRLWNQRIIEPLAADSDSWPCGPSPHDIDLIFTATDLNGGTFIVIEILVACVWNEQA